MQTDLQRLNEIDLNLGEYGFDTIDIDDVNWLIGRLRFAWEGNKRLYEQIDALGEELSDAWLVAKAGQ